MSLGGLPALTVAGTVEHVRSSFVVSNHSGKFLASFCRRFYASDSDLSKFRVT
jgi:hypothetical protein